jgi:hypothetical protein
MMILTAGMKNSGDDFLIKDGHSLLNGSNIAKILSSSLLE